MRFFFNISGSICEPDQNGSEFPDEEVARCEAVRFAGEVLIGEPQILALGPLQILVHSQDRSVHFVIEINLHAGLPGEVATLPH